ncbi:CPBP family intramembrane metalloprotease [Candidatus Thorarchaeota archaeon]|nr:MAG: CPBP family intramembrane metalloprotease [Candidatus Thorarchaeota archaeon]
MTPHQAVLHQHRVQRMEQVQNPSYREFGDPALVIVAASAVSTLVVLVYFIVALFVPFLSYQGVVANLYSNFLAQIVTALVLFALLSRLQAKRVDDSEPLLKGLWQTVLTIAGIVGVMVIGNLILNTLFQTLGLVPETGYTDVLLIGEEHLANPLNVVIFYAVASVGAPISEELLYRRIVIPMCESRGMGTLSAILSSTLAFALAHVPLDILNGNFAGAVLHFWTTFITGFALGVLYVLTRNLIYPILVHAAINAFSFTAYIGSLTESLAYLTVLVGLLYFILIPVGLIVVIYYGFWKPQKSEKWRDLKNQPMVGEAGSAMVFFVGVFLIIFTLLEVADIALYAAVGSQNIFYYILSLTVINILVATLGFTFVSRRRTL